MMEHRIEEIEAKRIIGKSIETSVQKAPQDCMALWNDVCKVDEQITRASELWYALCETTGECDFTYTAAREVAADTPVPEGLVEKTIPAGKYIVFTYKGLMSGMSAFYGQLMEEIPKAGYEENGTWLELYDERFKENAEDSEMEIWTGIKE
jgi:AraC family transcriptional regulator